MLVGEQRSLWGSELWATHVILFHDSSRSAHLAVGILYGKASLKCLQSLLEGPCESATGALRLPCYDPCLILKSL